MTSQEPQKPRKCSYSVVRLEGASEHDLIFVPTKWIRRDEKKNCFVPYISLPRTKTKTDEFKKRSERGLSPCKNWNGFACEIVKTFANRWRARKYVKDHNIVANKIHHRSRSRSVSTQPFDRPESAVKDFLEYDDEDDFFGSLCRLNDEQSPRPPTIKEEEITLFMTLEEETEHNVSSSPNGDEPVNMDTEDPVIPSSPKHIVSEVRQNLSSLIHNDQPSSNQEVDVQPEDAVVPENTDDQEMGDANLTSRTEPCEQPTIIADCSRALIQDETVDVPVAQANPETLNNNTVPSLSCIASNDDTAEVPTITKLRPISVEAFRYLYNNPDNSDGNYSSSLLNRMLEKMGAMERTISRLDEKFERLENHPQMPGLSPPGNENLKKRLFESSMLPCNTISQFEEFGKLLDADKEIQKFLNYCIEFIFFPHNASKWSLTKSIGLVLRRFMTQSLTIQFTGVRGTKKKSKVFIETAFYKYLKEYCLDCLNRYPELSGKKTEPEREREFRKGLAIVIANCKDWDGNRWKSHPPKNPKITESQLSKKAKESNETTDQGESENNSS